MSFTGHIDPICENSLLCSNLFFSTISHQINGNVEVSCRCGGEMFIENIAYCSATVFNLLQESLSLNAVMIKESFF